MNMEPKMAELVDASPLLADPAALRQQATRDGFLFFRRLLEPAKVLSLRRAILAVLRDAGWVLPGGDEPALRNPQQPALVEAVHPEFFPVYDQVQRLLEFHALAHDAALVGTLEKLLGESVLPHPRNIARLMFPDAPPTPPHQDYLHIRGTQQTWTSWIPLGDAPRELGGLAMLSGCHQRGLLPVRAMAGAGGSGIEQKDLGSDGRWYTTDYRAGDVILLHSLAPHMSMPNRTGNRMRLSVDYRFQPLSHPIHENSLQPHHKRCTWDDIYRHWPDTAEARQLQHYWTRLNLQVQTGLARSGY